jgi:SAM-dependent methyltransferase
MPNLSNDSKEFKRLQELGWNLPPIDESGVFCPYQIDESKISFPSECYELEDLNSEVTGFWMEQRSNSFLRLLKTHGKNLLWEIGAGNGSASIPLRKAGVDVHPIEPLRSGALQLVKNGFLPFQATLQDLHFPSNSIETLCAFDVLEHLEFPNDLLKEIERVLMPEGIFLCSVPAYSWLYSDFDESIGHFRRYSKKSLEASLDASGLSVIETQWLFGFLIFPAFVMRRLPFLLGRKRPFGAINKTNNPQSYFKGPIVGLLKLILLLEQYFKIPFGLSLVCVAKKKAIN